MDTLRFAEGWIPEDAPLQAARARSAEVGVSPVSTGVGACLRFLTALIAARSVVETGTGTGVSALWLLRGMGADGVLTSIDSEPEHLRLARASLADAEESPARTRLICGQALDVLPRLSDGGYDLVHLDCPPTELADQLDEAMRLLRPGGVLAVSGATWHGRVPDAGARDADTVAMRSAATRLREDTRLTPVLLPLGDGLLAAVSVGTEAG